MVSSETFWKAFNVSAKASGWFMYAAFIDFCFYTITMYFLREPEDDSDDSGENGTVFFTEKDNDCWTHICNKAPCGEDCAYLRLRKIIVHIEKAEKSLDVCIYLLTSYDITSAIVDAHNRGVNVRVITDSHRMSGTGSQISALIKNEVPVHPIKLSWDMHHKFFIVDKKTLINSSMNWTMQAVTGNREDVVICSSRVIVKKFVAHFDVFWDQGVVSQ